jgi:hypothetical protein
VQKFNVKLIVPVLPVRTVRTGTIVPVRSYWYFHFYVTEYIVEKYFLYRYDRTGTYRYDRTGTSRFNLATGTRVIFAHPIEIQNTFVRKNRATAKARRVRTSQKRPAEKRRGRARRLVRSSRASRCAHRNKSRGGTRARRSACFVTRARSGLGAVDKNTAQTRKCRNSRDREIWALRRTARGSLDVGFHAPLILVEYARARSLLRWMACQSW